MRLSSSVYPCRSEERGEDAVFAVCYKREYVRGVKEDKAKDGEG